MLFKDFEIDHPVGDGHSFEIIQETRKEIRQREEQRGFFQLDGDEVLSLKTKDGTENVSCFDLGTFIWKVSQYPYHISEKFSLLSKVDEYRTPQGAHEIKVYWKKERPNIDFSVGVVADFSCVRNQPWNYEGSRHMESRRKWIGYDVDRHAKFHIKQMRWTTSKKEDLLKWFSLVYAPVQQEIEKLPRNDADLVVWLNTGYDMGILCRNTSCSRERKFMRADEIKKYASKVDTIKAFRELLTCSRCGWNSPDIFPCEVL